MANKQLKRLTDYRPLDFGEAFNKYKSKHKRKKQLSDGTWVDWDTNTDQAWNDEAASTNVNQLVYGTATPKQDRSYLQAQQNLTNQKDLSKDAFAQIRRQFSPRTVNEGERQIDVTRAAKQREREQNVEALKQQSSFADPVKQQYDANVAMFRHNIESGYFSDQQIKSFAKSFYEFENTFDSKKYFDIEPEFNYVANNTEMARSADMLDKQNQLDAEKTNLSPGEEGDIEGEKKATSKQNQLQPPDANEDTTSEIEPSYMGGDNEAGVISAEQMKINKWFEDTATSPAAQAFKEGTEQQQTEWGKARLQAKENYDLFKKKRNRR